MTFRWSLGGGRWETEEQSNAAVEELRSSKRHLSRYRLQEASCQCSSCTLSFFPSDTHTNTHMQQTTRRKHFTWAINAVSIQGIINKRRPLCVLMRFGVSAVWSARPRFWIRSDAALSERRLPVNDHRSDLCYNRNPTAWWPEPRLAGGLEHVLIQI